MRRLIVTLSFVLGLAYAPLAHATSCAGTWTIEANGFWGDLVIYDLGEGNQNFTGYVFGEFITGDCDRQGIKFTRYQDGGYYQQYAGVINSAQTYMNGQFFDYWSYLNGVYPYYDWAAWYSHQ